MASPLLSPARQPLTVESVNKQRHLDPNGDWPEKDCQRVSKSDDQTRIGDSVIVGPEAYRTSWNTHSALSWPTSQERADENEKCIRSRCDLERLEGKTDVMSSILSEAATRETLLATKATLPPLLPFFTVSAFFHQEEHSSHQEEHSSREVDGDCSLHKSGQENTLLPPVCIYSNAFCDLEHAFLNISPDHPALPQALKMWSCRHHQ